MTIVPLLMNTLLGALLIAALVFGWRLERRLKALKASHESFAKAVADLDVAAMRAEQGLADLRAATAEASDSLAGRIEMAKALTAKLDVALAAPTPAHREAPAPRRTAAPDLLLDTPEPSPAPTRERAEYTRAEPATTARSRARVDDDLFEPDPANGRLRSIPGGRR